MSHSTALSSQPYSPRDEPSKPPGDNSMTSPIQRSISPPMSSPPIFLQHLGHSDDSLLTPSTCLNIISIPVSLTSSNSSPDLSVSYSPKDSVTASTSSPSHSSWKKIEPLKANPRSRMFFMNSRSTPCFPNQSPISSISSTSSPLKSVSAEIPNSSHLPSI